MADFSMNGEFAFINRIRERVQQSRVPAPELSLGVGDDAAVFRPRAGRELLITTDMLVEDIDFKLEYALPAWLGHKALAVSLSDIAAMGGVPRYAMLTLAISAALRSDLFWEAFFDGYFALAERRGVVLIGGDISATLHGLAIDSCVLGDCEAGRALRRSGAQIGDGIYVTGYLGAAAAGLQLLLRGARVDETSTSLEQQALRAHLRPAARSEFGQLLGERGLAHAMIDVSDGLAQDLEHLCEASHVSAVLDQVAVPVAKEVGLIATAAHAAFQLAVSGGEDYELLFTANGKAEAELQQLAQVCGLPLTRIGEIVAADSQTKVLLRTGAEIRPLNTHGYEHFKDIGFHTRPLPTAPPEQKTQKFR
ncbi:MAG: thiamine-phosphate kinase [Acidobacteria bacterium]|nr:thiamine-phosphate kinase [Acidobacteriota bacterium]MBI3421915.1 thiamine-phosphate kinase [Acidobacteriota bacterium]